MIPTDLCWHLGAYSCTKAVGDAVIHSGCVLQVFLQEKRFPPLMAAGAYSSHICITLVHAFVHQRWAIVGRFAHARGERCRDTLGSVPFRRFNIGSATI